MARRPRRTSTSPSQLELFEQFEKAGGGAAVPAKARTLYHLKTTLETTPETTRDHSVRSDVVRTHQMAGQKRPKRPRIIELIPPGKGLASPIDDLAPGPEESAARRRLERLWKRQAHQNYAGFEEAGHA